MKGWPRAPRGQAGGLGRAVGGGGGLGFHARQPPWTLVHRSPLSSVSRLNAQETQGLHMTTLRWGVDSSWSSSLSSLCTEVACSSSITCRAMRRRLWVLHACWESPGKTLLPGPRPKSPPSHCYSTQGHMGPSATRDRCSQGTHTGDQKSLSSFAG